ncbi:MAG: serine protease, partial [Clostridia bacterium]|nr:serine protease [Clostridia bacterium]
TEYEGIGYAIPTKTVRKIIGSLMEFGKVTNRAKLGITYRFYNDVMAKLSGVAVAGLEIDQVLPECQVFGKLSKGDIITHADGVKLTSDAVLLDMLEDSAPGDNLVLTVYRSDGTTDSITVKLIGDSGSSSYKVK